MMWPNRRCVWNSSVTNGFNGTANRYTPLQFWFQSYLDAACAPDNVILRAGPSGRHSFHCLRCRTASGSLGAGSISLSMPLPSELHPSPATSIGE